MSIMQGVTVHITRDFKKIPCSRRKIIKLVRAICKRFRLANAAVSIAIVGNRGMRKLNIEFLGHTNFTDCLAFDLSESSSSTRVLELVVNGERAKSQAAIRGHSPQAELALYITHGLLHNLGFDDLTATKAGQMHLLEDEILQQQGFGRVYDKKRKIVSNKQSKKC
jgi:probable rRNA maturation factor